MCLTVTKQSEAPDWMFRKSRHKIWIKDLRPYVFCKDYKKRHQIKKNGEYEIYFVDSNGKLFLTPSCQFMFADRFEIAADSFEYIFRSVSPLLTFPTKISPNQPHLLSYTV
jgi:hypothetical protein